MNHRASTPFKLSYCLALLGAIVPIGLASSDWVRASMGGGLLGLVPFAGTMLFLVLGLYRIFLVARVSGILDSPRVAGVAAVLRAVGLLFICAGAVVSILNWVSRPLMRLCAAPGEP